MWIVLFVVIQASQENSIYPSHFGKHYTYSSKEECESFLFSHYKGDANAKAYRPESLSIHTNHLGNTFYRNSEISTEMHCVEIKE
jgi:hypothetical protein